LYIPVTDDAGRQLVDGGLVAVIPSSACRSLGAEIVIAVDVNAEGATFIGPAQSIIGVVLQSMLVVQRTASLYQTSVADMVIKPRVGHIRWDELARAKELIAAGYEAGLASIPGINEVVEASIKAQPKWYQLRRRKKFEAKARLSLPT
jgi:NTE family protein